MQASLRWSLSILSMNNQNVVLNLSWTYSGSSVAQSVVVSNSGQKEPIPHICHFSPHMQFLVKFSPHKSARIATKHILRQNSVNCDKNDCTTKQNKFYIYVETFSTSHTCKRWRNFRFVHICDVEKLEISPYVEKLQISPYLSHLEIWNISTWQISLQIYCWYWWQIWGM